jgi:hypothetical protein
VTPERFDWWAGKAPGQQLTSLRFWAARSLNGPGGGVQRSVHVSLQARTLSRRRSGLRRLAGVPVCAVPFGRDQLEVFGRDLNPAPTVPKRQTGVPFCMRSAITRSYWIAFI